MRYLLLPVIPPKSILCKNKIPGSQIPNSILTVEKGKSYAKMQMKLIFILSIPLFADTVLENDRKKSHYILQEKEPFLAFFMNFCPLKM